MMASGSHSIHIESDEVHQNNCDVCLTQGNTSVAVSYCTICDEYLCQGCEYSHKGSKATRGHTLLTGSSVPSRSIKTKPTLPIMYCERHKTSLLELYCITHDQVMCTMCTMTNHKKCDKVSITSHVNISSNIAGMFRKVVKDLEDLQTKFSTLQKSRQKDKTAMKAQVQTCLKDMHQIRQEVINKLDELERKMAAEIKEFEDKLSKEIDDHDAMSNNVLHHIIDLNKSLDECQNTRDDDAMFIGMKKAESRKTEFEEIIGSIQEDIYPINVRIEPNEILTDVINQIQTLGTLVTGDQTSDSNSAGPITSNMAGPGTSNSAGPITSNMAGPGTSNSAGPITSNMAGPGTSNSAGPITSNMAGPGTSNIAGSGTSNMAGPGTSNIAGPGTSNIAGSGTSNFAGPGTSNMAGPGTSNFAGPVTSNIAGPGTSNIAGPGTSNIAGPGTSNFAGPGKSNTAGPGTSNSAGPGTSNMAGPGTSNIAGPGTSNFAGPGISNIAGPGTSNIAGPGTSNMAGPGISNMAGPGTSNIAGPGTSNIAGPGISNIAGSGTSTIAGPGTSNMAGPGISNIAGPGTSNIAGPGTSNIAGPGTSNIAGTGTSTRHIPSFTKSLLKMTVGTKQEEISLGPEHVRGCTFMPDGHLVVACGTEGLKLFDRAFNYTSELSVASLDVAVLNDNDVIVSQGPHRQLQRVQVVPTMAVKSTIKMDRKCFGVDVYGGEIYVTCHDSQGHGEVVVLDINGRKKKRLGVDNDVYMFESPYYVKVSQDGSKLFVSDFDTDTVTCLNQQDHVIYRYCDKDLERPRGMYVDGEDNLLVCGRGSNNVHVVRHDGTREKILLSQSDGMWRPWGISYRQSDGCLDVVMGLGRDTTKLVVYTTKI